jgi:hypothetical protein
MWMILSIAVSEWFGVVICDKSLARFLDFLWQNVWNA